MPGCLRVVLWFIGGFIVIAVAATIFDRVTGPLPGARHPDQFIPADESAAAGRAAAAANNVKLLKFSWRKGGFGTVMIGTFTIANENEFAVKDIPVACKLTAPSGTVLGVAAATIYERFAPHSRKTISELNMGSPIAIDFSQAAGASCELGPFGRD
jgi:hypothetical protein